MQDYGNRTFDEIEIGASATAQGTELENLKQRVDGLATKDALEREARRLDEKISAVREEARRDRGLGR